MKNFAGKTAVVTGAASGIGLALAEKLARENMQVVMADVEEESLEVAVEAEINPVASLLRRGKKPSEIADIAFDAINEEVFYILTHPLYDELLRDRFDKILSRKPLALPSAEERAQFMAKFFAPRDDGESF
jgi:nucleoside-diphosphate-sugar epimerase